MFTDRKSNRHLKELLGQKTRDIHLNSIAPVYATGTLPQNEYIIYRVKFMNN